MTVRLRPHHLLCLLTYAGKGYSLAFTANYDAIAKRISLGEEILIVEGPDDICAPLLDDKEPHCWRDSVTDRDRLAASDLGEVLACSVTAGTRMILTPEILQRMRTIFATGHIRAACRGCQWADLCSSIASNNYHGTAVSGSL